jgi:acetoin utilization protein AcuB
MFISDYMTANPLTISAEMVLPEARQLLIDYHFRHLPVVDKENRLIGVVSDRDLRSAYPSTVLSDAEREKAFKKIEKISVGEIMSRNCSCLTLSSTLDDALTVFERDKVGALPVVTEEDEVIGIFSMRDLTAAYKKLFGAAEKGSELIAILNDSKSKSLIKIVSLLTENDIQCTRLINIGEVSGFDRIYLRVSSSIVSEVHKLLQEHGFTLLKP